jgi:hypothetical protein
MLIVTGRTIICDQGVELSTGQSHSVSPSNLAFLTTNGGFLAFSFT